MTSASATPALANVPDGLFIDGRWVEPVGAQSLTSIRPTTGRPLRDFAAGTVEDVDRAVRAARAALEGPWSSMRPHDRQSMILRFAELVDEHFDELTMLDVLDMGLPITPAGGWREVLQRGLRFYAAAALSIRGETIPHSMPAASGHYQAYTLKEPVGVVGAIASWNGPRWQTCKKFGATLATGCTLVMKPSEEASLTVLRMTDLAREAGVPDGVINVVTGDHSVGAALARHPGVDRIVFVGSVATARAVLDGARDTLKRVTLELGGKAPHVVFADADLERAARGVVMGAFANSGQFCVAGSRLFVERRVSEAFVDEVVKRTEALVVGPSEDPGVQIGPLISARQRDRVRGHLVTAERDGARVLTGGAHDAWEEEPGFYMVPTIVGDVGDDAAVAREEIFGPVLTVFVFDDVDEVIARANDTPYGLTAGVWTESLGTAARMVGALRAGTVWVNDYLPLEPALPHGGVKLSGYGREGGMEQIEEYLETKAVLIRTHA